MQISVGTQTQSKDYVKKINNDWNYSKGAN